MRSAASLLFVVLVLSLMGARCSCSKNDEKKSEEDTWVDEEAPVAEDVTPAEPQPSGMPLSADELTKSPTPTPTPTPAEDVPGPESLGGDEDM